MTPSEKLIKAFRVALKHAKLDGLEGMTGAAIFIQFKKAGEAEVEIKPTIASRIDLTEAFA